MRWLSSVIDAGGTVEICASLLVGSCRRRSSTRQLWWQQAFENGGCHHLIAVGAAFSEGVHLVPFLHRAVGADQHTALLVAAGDQLEEQVPRLGFEGQVAQFFDDQQFRLAEVGAFYWTDLAPDIVNPGREEQGSVSL